MAWTNELDEVSPADRIAADTSRRIRVLAGPGTGKSSAMKQRVKRLLRSGVSPNRILAVTFTVVAAEDLQRDLRDLGVLGCEQIKCCTLHSLGMQILSKQNVLKITGRIARPLNRFEINPLLYDLSESHGRKEDKKKKIKAYEAAWARLQHDNPGHPQPQADIDFEHDLISWLRFHRGMLIGEIIPEIYKYLSNNPLAAELREYDHILVDEYQDLNRAEQEVVDLLAESGHIFIVGDDDQSIYSFKYAHPEGIRSFGQRNDVSNHTIGDCYRCPTKVVELANSLISHNQNRDPRFLTPKADRGAGEIYIRQYKNVQHEADAIAEFVERQINDGYHPGDILILAQRRAIGAPIAECLKQRGIPAKSYYEESALDSFYAQERLSILKLVVDRNDRIALRWLLGTGVDKDTSKAKAVERFRSKAYARVRGHCENSGVTPWDAMCQLSGGALHLPHTHKLLGRFKEIRDEVEALSSEKDLSQFVDQWLSGSVQTDENFKQLIDDVISESDSVSDLLNNIVQRVVSPEVPPNVQDVRVMSLHKSKGLSSPVVIIAGCVEGLLPREPEHSVSAVERDAIIEEDRRVFYVGLTRVKADPAKGKRGVLLLTAPQSMASRDARNSNIRFAKLHRGRVQLHMSRFIRELGSSAPRVVAG